MWFEFVDYLFSIWFDPALQRFVLESLRFCSANKAYQVVENGFISRLFIVYKKWTCHSNVSLEFSEIFTNYVGRKLSLNFPNERKSVLLSNHTWLSFSTRKWQSSTASAGRCASLYLFKRSLQSSTVWSSRSRIKWAKFRPMAAKAKT